MNQVIDITSEEQLVEAAETNQKAVVLFTAPSWCRPCKAFEPQYNEAATLTDVPLYRVDIDHNPWVANYSIRQVPTIHLYESGELLIYLRPASAAAFAQSIEE